MREKYLKSDDVRQTFQSQTPFLAFLATLQVAMKKWRIAESLPENVLHQRTTKGIRGVLDSQYRAETLPTDVEELRLQLAVN